MKYIGIFIFLIGFNSLNLANTIMNKKNIQTSIGEITCYTNFVENTIPIIFLHGVYYDHNLWNYYTSRIQDRTTITLDMPLHGNSKNITKKNWTIDDCSQMLLEILENLNIEKCYAVGHSWGSMTILRAQYLKPQKFAGIVLCNMPVEAGNNSKKIKFGFQHLMLSARKFYTKQVAKAMFSSENMNKKPELSEYLEIAMGKLSNKEVKQTDKAIITNVNSGKKYLDKFISNTFVIKGDDDYVKSIQQVKTHIVAGKHTSPLEQPEIVLAFINKMLMANQ